jgi:hypothetical protein
MIVPLYISGVAPASYRGRMRAFDNLSVTFEKFVAPGSHKPVEEGRKHGEPLSGLE